MNVKLEILLCVVSVAFANAFYNQAPVDYNPYYSFGNYPIGTQEEYEYYDNSYGRAPVAPAYSAVQQNQVPFVAYNTRVVSPVFHPTAAPEASNVQVTSAPVQAVQPTGFSTTPVPLTDVNFVSQQQQIPVVPAASTTVAPILSKSNQLGFVYPFTGTVPAVSTYDANNVVATSNLGNVNFQSSVNPTVATSVAYSTTQNPIYTGNINVPSVVAAKSNVVPYPYFNPHLNNIVSSSGYNFALNQGTNYNVNPTFLKTNGSYFVPYAGNSGGYVSTPSGGSQNVYVPFIFNQALNNGNLYSSTASKSNVPLQPSSGIINSPLYHSAPNPLVQNVFGSGSSFASSLSQPQILPTGNLVGSVPASAGPVNVIAAANSFNSFPRAPQPVIATVSPKDASNIISYSTTTPREFDGFVPVTSTYTSVKKQTIYAAPPIVPQPNAPSLYYTGSAGPVTYNINSNRLLQNPLVANQGLLYTSTPVGTLSPSVFHNGTPSPVIYSTTPTPVTTTTPASTSSTQEISSQVTTTARPTIIATQKPSSSSTYIINETTKLATAPVTTQSFNDYVSKTGVQSATILRPSTMQNTANKVSFSTVRPGGTQTVSYVPSFSAVTSERQTVKYPLKPASSIATSSTAQSNFFTQRPTIASIQRQDAFAASLSGFPKPSSYSYKPPVTNNYVEPPCNCKKGIQRTYTTPSTSSTTSYTTLSSLAPPKPTVSYNSVNRQDAFTAALSGFSKPSTYKPSVTNNYVSSSSIYNKGIQSTYTTPAAISTPSYATVSSFATPKPTISYNRQDAFTAALSGFSKPSTYKPSVTNNYISSSSVYDKGIQSTYSTPATISRTSYTTPSSFAIPKPTVSYNSVNRQDAFTAALSGFSKPSTFKPSVTNNYVSSSSIYNKGIQSTYTTPATISTPSYATSSSFATPKPTISYNRQDAFTAALSGFSKPSTYKPSVNKNYISSSSIYNKGIQSTYTTPATISTISYATPSSFATPIPTVSYNSVNRQDAFTASPSGFSKPSTYKPPVTNNYVSSSSIYNKGIQSTYTTPAAISTPSYATVSSFATPKPTISYNRQDAFTAALSGFSKPSTYKPSVTNNYISSSSIYDKGIQSTYTTPATISTTSYATPSSFATPKPTVSYNSVNRQDAFTAALSGFSKPSTYKPSVTNNYVSSSSIYDKGIQSTYTTPATISTISYATPSSFATPVPTVSYNSVNRQDAFTASHSGFSKPSTYKPPVTNNYVSSSSIYNKGIQSTYTTPAAISTPSYATVSSFATPKPTISYNRQDAFTAALSGFSKPSTYKPSVTNNYISSSSIYDKGIQSTYTTPATISTTSYATPSSFATPKPTVSYNSVNRQDAFTAALSGFSKPSTYKPSVTNNYVSSSSIYDKDIQSTYTTPATISTPSYATSSSFATPKPTNSYNRQDAFTAALSGFSKPSTYKPFVTNNYVSSSSIYDKGIQSTYTTPATYSTTYNTPSSPVTTIKNAITQSTNTDFVKPTSYPSTFKFNSFANRANSIYQLNLAKPKYTPFSSTINKSYNQYVPFVNIPASTGYLSSSISSNQKKEFIPVVSNYDKGLNVIIQPPVSSETGATVAPSILDYSSTYVSQSTPPPEAVSSFVHSDQYLPPVHPVVSDVGSNVVSYISDPVVTSTLATPLVVSTTPRTLPLSYSSPGQEEKVVAYTNQASVQPVLYTTTPVITKVDFSPTLTPVSYAVPASSEYAQVSSEQPLAYSAAPAVTTVNYV